MKPFLSTAIVLLGGASTLLAQNFTTFDLPDSIATMPTSINLRGQIVGSYTPSIPDILGFRRLGFLREPGGAITTVDAGALAGLSFGRTFATGVNLGGRVSGYVVDADCGDCAFSFVRKPNGTLNFFRAPDTLQSRTEQAVPWGVPNYIRGTDATDINLFGQVAGVKPEGFSSQGFVMRSNGAIDEFNVPGVVPPEAAPQTVPQSINDLGQITGYANASTLTFHGFLRNWNGKTSTFDPFGSTATYPLAINLFGEITGFYITDDGRSHGFLRRWDGKITTVDPSGSIGTQVNSINLYGSIVGYYLDAAGITHSFVRWPNGRIVSFDVPESGAINTFAQDINDLGRITGYYTDLSGTHGFVVRFPH